MTTEQEAELAARVARLQQRRGNTGAKSASTRSATPKVADTTPVPAATATTTPAPDATPKVAGADSHFAFRPTTSTTSTAITGSAGPWAAPTSSALVSSTPPASMFAKIATVTGIHKIVQVANAHHEAQIAYEAQPDAKVIDKQTNLKVTKSRRRHAAAAGRVLATGLATSGFLGTITALAQADQHPEKSADPATDGEVVVRTVERTIYVDEFGNPVAPPVSTVPAAVVDPNTTVVGAVVDPNATVPAVTLVAGQVLPVTPVPGAPTPAPVPGAPVATVKPGAAPVTTAKAGTPVAAAPAPGAAAPAPAAPAPAAPTPAAPAPAAPTPAAPTPAPTPAPAPAPTPAPVTTQPPAPVTTAAPAPVTTAPPACTGSKCP